MLFLGLAGLTLGLMALGSATRVMNAGLSCPDWPLCFGSFVPKQQMNLQVFLEWFHRLVASTVGVCVLGLNGLVLVLRQRLPRWLPWATGLCFGLVVFQGILGGLTVTQLLRFDIVTAHLATGLLFFSSLVTIGTALMPYQGTGMVNYLPWASFTAVGLIYLQSILGALVASRWAVHQCLGSASLCSVLYSHFIGVVPAALSVLIVVVMAGRTAALHPLLRRLTQLAALLLGLQVGLGLSTLKFHLQIVVLTVAHQFIGASLLGVVLAMSVIALRDRLQAKDLPTIHPSTVAPSPLT
ncbi:MULTISPECIES: COX15/CtaA family protein [Oscillatoriophycideae]|uniref:COX15/CtaA family protein n=2 Tax=Lyngbya TaxID=28073 RepID=A0ABD4T683_9CYAN|nr:COX15/CtaA family protein [Lyngbya confervoides]MCM1984065.1 COX15/CtaA family protein [Lyngbya confervoides BDU141951]